MADETDELEDLLAPPLTAETPGLRDAVLRRTLRKLAVVCWSRRAAKCAAVAAVFALGVWVGAWRTPVERETVLVTAPAEVQFVPVLVPLPPVSPEPPVIEPARTAKALELDAEQADGLVAAGLYRRAGDAYLSAEEDYANAARCYRLFLARGGEPALTPETSDSWLLTSLKNAAFREKVHAPSDD